MNEKKTFLAWWKRHAPLLITGLLVLVGLYATSRLNYLLFHSVVEMFSILIAFTIFVLGWNARRYLADGYLVFLGMALLFVGGITLLHALAYRGMGVFEADADLPTQLWLAERYLFGLAFVAAPFFFRRPLHRIRQLAPILLVLTLYTVGVVLSIFVWQNFPVAFIEGKGLTPFKIASEYIIIVLFGTAAFLLVRNRQHFDRSIFNFLMASLAANILAEFLFTTYITVDDIRNLLGHFLQVMAFYLIYKAVIETGFLKPQRLLFRDLAAANATLRAREAELMASEGSYRELFETMVEGFVLHEAIRDEAGQIVDFRLVEVNPAYEVMTGTPREQAQGKTIRAMLPATYQNWIDRLAPVVESGVSTQFEYQDDSNDRVFEVKGYRPTVGRCAVVLSDVTDRRRGQEALRLSEARLRRLVESNIIGILFSNDDGSIPMVNDAFLEMLGFSRQAFENGMLNWVNLTPPEHLTADLKGMAEARERGACTPYEKEFIHANGTRVPVLIGYAFLHESTPRYIAFILDLTQRKQSEVRLESYALQLERSNRELQDFAFVASHDLQEPLRKIQAFGDRLKVQLASRLLDDERDYLDRMLNAAGRMRSMVSDLLALSRITTRGQPFLPVDLNEVAREVVSDLETRIQASGGQVELENLPQIEADPMQMYQLLQNLIGNALKFYKEDTLPIVRVYSDGVDHENNVTIYVKDNGIGFEEQYLERIFQPFQRLHGLGRYEGSGIGLAICRKIVERHSGKITASSTPGQGACFQITLPVRQRG